MRPACGTHSYPEFLFHLCSTAACAVMGEFSRHFLHSPRKHTVLPSDIHDIPAEKSGQSKHPDDVYSNSWQLCMGWFPCCEAGSGGVVRVGSIPRDRLSARVPPGNGHLLRSRQTEARERGVEKPHGVQPQRRGRRAPCTGFRTNTFAKV